mgnify:CR=1 FL=1
MVSYLRSPRRYPVNRLDQGLRPEWLCKVGNATGFDRGHADSGIVIGSDVNHRQGNAGRPETKPQFDSRFVVQVDVENHATCRLEIVVLLELLGGRKHDAVVTVMAQQALQPLEHPKVVIDDKNDIPIPQDG